MPILALLTKEMTILPPVGPIFLAVAEICVWLTQLWSLHSQMACPPRLGSWVWLKATCATASLVPGTAAQLHSL